MRVALGCRHRVQSVFSTTNERIRDEQQEAQGNAEENDIMFRPDRAGAHSGMEDRGDRIGREGQGEEVLVQLAGVPADALAVPAPVQPQRDRGRLEDIRGGAVAGAWHNACESQHVLQREPHARPEGDADVLLDRVRHLPQRGAGLHKKELKQTLQLQDFYGENENAVEECARTKGVGSGERSELRSSLKAPRRYGLLSCPISSCGGSSTGRVRRAATRASPRSSVPSSG